MIPTGIDQGNALFYIQMHLRVWYSEKEIYRAAS